MAIEVFAPAKVNLALHVTGRRANGYHLLDSLVVFAGIGDRITVAADDRVSLTITGPEGAGLGAGPDNLVLRAARAFGCDRGAAITLEKTLPVASGIGGGSADAAAALKALAQLWGLPLPDGESVLALGADVPVCLGGRAVRMTGIGDVLCPAPHLPEGMALLLVNPRVEVATPDVFRGLTRRDNAPLADLPPDFSSAEALARWLSQQRNDLETPARAAAPVIGDVLERIGATGSLVARMSGSGATCFGLFADLVAAERAARDLLASQSGWWVRAAPVLRDTGAG